MIIYHQTSNIRRTFDANKIVDHSNVVGAAFHSRLDTWFHWIGQRQEQDETRIILSFGILCDLYQRFYGNLFLKQWSNADGVRRLDNSQKKQVKIMADADLAADLGWSSTAMIKTTWKNVFFHL